LIELDLVKLVIQSGGLMTNLVNHSISQSTSHKIGSSSILLPYPSVFFDIVKNNIYNCVLMTQWILSHCHSAI